MTVSVEHRAELYVPHGEYVAKGGDSRAFRVQESDGYKAAKIYYPHVDIALAQDYLEATNKAAEILEEQQVGGQLKVGEEVMPYRFFVNPMERVYWDKENKAVVSVSKYIDGPRMSHLLEPPVSILDKVELEKELKGLPSQEADLFRNIIPLKILGQERSDKMVQGLSQLLSYSLPAFGVELIAENTKVRWNPASGQFDFIVTDLSMSLRRFSFRADTREISRKGLLWSIE